MNKKCVILSIMFVFLTFGTVYAKHCCDIPTNDEIKKEHDKIDKYLDSRLHFSNEQKVKIKQNRQSHRKEIEPIVIQMQNTHNEIRNIYMLGIPKYQADIRTAPKKAQLVLLKQNAKMIRDEHRKVFESILNDEQRAEFEIIKKEHAQRKQQQQQK